MRKDITVAAEPRDSRGKNEARRLRARGMAPAIVYGAGQDPVAVAVSPKDIGTVIYSSTGHNTVFMLRMQDTDVPVMVVDEQYEPIKGKLLHLDLKRIDLTRKIRVRVPVVTTGEPIGVKLQGGSYELVTREVEIEVLPEEIPDSFTVDVANLGVGQSIRTGTIPLSGSMKLVSDPELLISHVVGVRGADADETAAAVAEPEVVKKGKKEDAAAPAADKTKKK